MQLPTGRSATISSDIDGADYAMCWKCECDIERAPDGDWKCICSRWAVVETLTEDGWMLARLRWVWWKADEPVGLGGKTTRRLTWRSERA